MYSKLCVEIAAFFCIEVTSSGKGGDTEINFHNNLIRASSASVKPIDLCSAKNQLRSSLPYGKSTIYMPKINIHISKIAISQCIATAIEL